MTVRSASLKKLDSRHFDQLPELHQFLLYSFAFEYTPQTLTTIPAALKTIWPAGAKDPFPTQIKIRAALNKLMTEGWLKKQYGQHMLPNGLADFLFQKALVTDRLDKLIAACNQGIEKNQTVYRSYMYSGSIAGLRSHFGFYQGNLKQFQEFTSRLRAIDPIPLFELVVPGAFERLSIDCQHFLIPQLIDRVIRDGVGSTETAEIVDKILAQDSDFPLSLFDSIVQWAVATGNLQCLRELHSLYGDERPEAEGCEAFLTGDFERALDCLTRAQSCYRKRSKNRKGLVPNFPTLFHFALLLKQDTAAARAEIAKLLKSSAQTGNWFRFKDRIALAVNLQENPSLKIRQLVHDAYNEPEIEILFQAWLMQWFSDSEPAAKLLSRSAKGLSSLTRNYRRIKLDWLANECATLAAIGYAKSKPSPPDSQVPDSDANSRSPDSQISQLTTLCHWLKPAPLWERSLKALQSLAEQVEHSGPAAGSTDSVLHERLIWEIGGVDKEDWFEIAPILQSRNKSGGWNKGRPVALKRLFEEQIQLEYLTDHDRRICSAIRLVHDYDYYNRGSYQWDYPKMAQALIGHPLVFRKDEREVPLEIVGTQPQLIVARNSNQQIELRLNPKISKSDVQFAIRNDGAHRIAVTLVDDRCRKLISILAAGARFPKSAQERVVAATQKLASTVTVHSSIAGSSTETIPANPNPCAFLSPVQQGLRCEFYVRPLGETGPMYRPGEGGTHVFGEIEGRAVTAERNLKEEKIQIQQVLASCPILSLLDEPDLRYVLPDWEQALELVLQLQSSAETLPLTLHWPQGESFKIKREASVSQFRIQIRKDRDWFAASGNLELDKNQSLDLMRLMELLDQGSSRFVKLDDGEFLALTEQLLRRIEELSFYGERTSDRLRFAPIRATALEELVEQTQAKTDKHWKEQVRRIEHARSFTPELPKMLQTELRDYQAEGYVWLRRLAEWGVGGCLADDMGLGKTVQAIALLLERAHQGPSLVVAPTSVGFNWQNELVRFAPSLQPKLFGATDRDQFFAELGPRDVAIATYGLLNNEAKRFQAVQWNTVILDEAQAIKNMATKRSQVAMKLQADFRLIMTGTPLENHLGELWNLFQFINPGLLGSWEQFQSRFANPIERTDCRATRHRLKKLVQPFLLRRTKTQVLSELPARTEVTRLIEMSREEAAFYEALRRKAIANLDEDKDESKGAKHLRILAELMKLRRACCHSKLVMPELGISSSKLAMFSETMDEIIENHHKVLVFSQFVDHLKILREELDRKGIAYQYLDGSTPAKERKKRVEAFQSGEGDAFLISLKAGGSGLNLTAADYVIHMDPWWNPAVEDQASDRAHRIGQKRPVTIYRFITQGTIEEKIVELHQTKRNLADSLLEGSDTASKLSAEELMKLIQE